MAVQIGEEMARAVDSDLVAEMDANAVYKTATQLANAITDAEIEEGFDNFGDDVDVNSYAGIIINSRLRSSFVKSDSFVKADYTFSRNGNGRGDANGVIGYYLGTIPVIVCNNGTFDSTKNESKCYIVKKNALGVIWQKEANIEEERESLKKATLLSSDELYAVKLLNSKGVVILRKTIA